MPEVGYEEAKALKDKTAREMAMIPSVVRQARDRMDAHERRIRSKPRKPLEEGELSDERLHERGANPPGPEPEPPARGPCNETLLLAANKLEHAANSRAWKGRNDQSLGVDARVNCGRQAEVLREAAAIIRGLMTEEPPPPEE